MLYLVRGEFLIVGRPWGSRVPRLFAVGEDHRHRMVAVGDRSDRPPAPVNEDLLVPLRMQPAQPSPDGLAVAERRGIPGNPEQAASGQALRHILHPPTLPAQPLHRGNSLGSRAQHPTRRRSAVCNPGGTHVGAPPPQSLPQPADGRPLTPHRPRNARSQPRVGWLLRWSRAVAGFGRASACRPSEDCLAERPLDGGRGERLDPAGLDASDACFLIDSRRWPRLRSVPTTSDFERMLRGVALRVTRPRVAVLTALHDHPHADTDSIISVVRENLGDVSHQAVYDVLRALTDAGLVRRIQPLGSVARYEARVRDNHHHVVCRSCGAIADVDCAVGDAPCLTAADDSGYEIDEAEVIYWGRCPECVAATSAAAGG